MKRPEQYPSIWFIPELIEDEDIIFNKDSEYHKQKKKEKKNPIFKRNKFKKKMGALRRQINGIYQLVNFIINSFEIVRCNLLELVLCLSACNS